MVRAVAYKLELPQGLSRIHNMFHVSNLKKCYVNEPLAVPLDGLHIDDKLHFIEELVEIMDREVKLLKQSRIPKIKVRWNSRRGPEFTWEREDQFRKKYPHYFTKAAPSDPNTLIELKDKQRINFFVDIQKTIKVDGGKDLGNVGVIKVRWVNDMTFMKEASLEVFKDGSIGVLNTHGTMMLGDITGDDALSEKMAMVMMGSSMAVFGRSGMFETLKRKERTDRFEYLSARSLGTFWRKDLPFFKEDEEQISMRELEYQIEKHYERDVDDDHD
ncbi:hypothetical protein Tco_0349065 [Tanacetum coccineum]